MLDLTKFKSAKVLSDPGAISAALKKRDVQIVRSQATGKDMLEKIGFISPIDSASYTMPNVDELKSLATKIALPWDDQYAQRAVPFWASDERPDRHTDIVEQSWVFNDFKNNPVLLYSHDYELPPIGNCLSWDVVNRVEGEYSGDALQMLTVFATKDQWEWADTIYRLVQANIMRTVSVGFYPGQLITINDAKEREELGLGIYGYIYRDNDLLELSPTSVPANAGAYRIIAAGASKGAVQFGDLQVLREIRRREMQRDGKKSTDWRNADTTMIAFWKSFFPSIKVNASTDIDAPLLLDEILAGGTTTTRTTPPPKTEPDEPNMKNVMDMLNQIHDKMTATHDKVDKQETQLDDLLKFVESKGADDDLGVVNEDNTDPLADLLLGAADHV